MNDDELQQRLTAHDPAASLPMADPAWVARLLEDTMTDTLETRQTGTRNRNPLTWLVAAAAAILIAGVGVFGLLNNDRESSDVPSAGDTTPAVTEPTVTQLSAGPGIAAKCMVPNAEILSGAEIAFSGTVDEVTDDTVTLTPDRFYAGEATDVVTVNSPSELLPAMISAVEFKAGQRYLVSANGGSVSVCGFSGPYSADLAALYDAAFPG